MLTEDGCLQRQERLWACMPQDVEIVVIYSPEHLTYFSNYFLSPFRYHSVNSQTALILQRSGNNILVVDNLTKRL